MRRLVTLFLILLALAAGCHRPEAAPAPRDAPLTILQAYPVAREWAQQWREDSHLERASAIMAGAGAVPAPESIGFRFVVDRRLGPFRWWDSALLTVDPYRGIVAEAETYTFQTHRHRTSPFDLSGVVLDSRDAVRLAEARGGAAYRAERPEARIRMRMHHGQIGTGDLWWYLEYFTPPDYATVGLSFSINAATGEVREW